MFQGIGKIGDYVRQHNLHLMMNHKLATGETVDLNRPSPLAVSYVSSADKAKKKSSAADKRRVASIKQKLKNGEKLSASDMKFLKDTDTALYRTAKTVQEAREELERDLRRAKTKGEARMAVVRAMGKVAQEAQMSQSAGAGAGAAGGMDAAAGGMAAGGAGGAMTAGGGMGDAMTVGGSAAAGSDAATGSAVDGVAKDGAVNAPDTAGAEPTAGVGNVGLGKAPAAATGDAKASAAKAGPQSLADAMDAGDDDPLPPTLLLVIRSLQNAWSKFVKSDEFKELPADELEEAQRAVSGHRRLSKQQRQMAAAIAYHDAALAALAMNGKPGRPMTK